MIFGKLVDKYCLWKPSENCIPLMNIKCNQQNKYETMKDIIQNIRHSDWDNDIKLCIIHCLEAVALSPSFKDLFQLYIGIVINHQASLYILLEIEGGDPCKCVFINCRPDEWIPILQADKKTASKKTFFSNFLPKLEICNLLYGCIVMELCSIKMHNCMESHTPHLRTHIWNLLIYMGGCLGMAQVCNYVDKYHSKKIFHSIVTCVNCYYTLKCFGISTIFR
jgi:hypothetical protein